MRKSEVLPAHQIVRCELQGQRTVVYNSHSVCVCGNGGEQSVACSYFHVSNLLLLENHTLDVCFPCSLTSISGEGHLRYVMTEEAQLCILSLLCRDVRGVLRGWLLRQSPQPWLSLSLL